MPLVGNPIHVCMTACPIATCDTRHGRANDVRVHPTVIPGCWERYRVYFGTARNSQELSEHRTRGCQPEYHLLGDIPVTTRTDGRYRSNRTGDLCLSRRVESDTHSIPIWLVKRLEGRGGALLSTVPNLITWALNRSVDAQFTGEADPVSKFMTTFPVVPETRIFF